MEHSLSSFVVLGIV